MTILWQILPFIALALIVVVLVFAIIEPGPLQERRTFGKRRRARDETDMDDSTIDSTADPSVDRTEQEEQRS